MNIESRFTPKMATFLTDRHSPIRSGIAPKLRHRSRHSESENPSAESPTMSLNHDDGISSGTNNEDSYDPVQDNEASYMAEKRTVKSKSMLSHFMTELTRDYKLEGDASEFVERRDRVYTSVNTPKNLEKFCAFGFLQCLDSILYMVTFLPLRIVFAIVRVLTYPCAVIFTGHGRVLDGAQKCDILKGVILVASCFITSYMDMSMIYHIVRGQSIIKFYVFYNMLDVMDKLVSGFGQDVLDSLYWTAVEPRGRKREHFGTIFHLILSIVYVVIHTVMILIQAIILNVAFNSHNKNLLTIMMSNNFVEIKGNLFKRLDKNNLCQITYSDVKERFHYLVLLSFVFIRNMKELQWSWDMAFPIIQDAAIVMFVEVIVDWIKHAFITKFNELSASSYADFALGLAQDIASSQKKHAFTNFSDQVCRRMGFTPIPLICLLFMLCTKSFNIKGSLAWLLVFLFYLCLMSTKVLNSIILLGWAQRLITERDKTAKSTGTVVNSQVIPKKEDKAASPKAKSENVPETPIPIIITSRPTAVSSSVAVNTDPTLSAESASLDSMAHVGENSTPCSSGRDMPISHHQGAFLVCQSGSFQDIHYQDPPDHSKVRHSVSCETALPIAPIDTESPKPPLATGGHCQHTSPLDTVSHLGANGSPRQATHSQPIANEAWDETGSGAVDMTPKDFQTDYGGSYPTPSSLTSHGEPNPGRSSTSPHLYRSVSSPAKAPSSPKRKHPDSPSHSFDSLFDSPELLSGQKETVAPFKPNIMAVNLLEMNEKGSRDPETDSIIPQRGTSQLAGHISNVQDFHEGSSSVKDEDASKPHENSKFQHADKPIMPFAISHETMPCSHLADDDVSSPEGYS